jgi:hypothetical protein
MDVIQAYRDRVIISRQGEKRARRGCQVKQLAADQAKNAKKSDEKWPLFYEVRSGKTLN